MLERVILSGGVVDSIHGFTRIFHGIAVSTCWTFSLEILEALSSVLSFILGFRITVYDSQPSLKMNLTVF